MRDLPSSEHIIRDIEFEILLGTIPQENLGNAVLSIKAHHDKLWSELLEVVRDGRLREVFNKIFQFQDMLLVLLQEMSILIGALQVSLSEIVRCVERSDISAWQEVAVPVKSRQANGRLFPQSSTELSEIAKFMRSEFLTIDPEVRSSKLPLIGKVVRSLRIALHHLVLFYVNRLGARQSQVNTMYGEQILAIFQAIEDQQAQINAIIEEFRSRT